jgi:hypothetical protein
MGTAEAPTAAQPEARRLTAAELPSEALCAGDTLEYYSPAFVCGNPRGHRLGVVLRVAQQANVEFPVTVDTNEILTRTTLVRRTKDKQGNIISGGKWRKIRTFDLVDSYVDAPLQSERLNLALRSVVRDSYAAVRSQLRDERVHAGAGLAEEVNTPNTDSTSFAESTRITTVTAPKSPLAQMIQTPTEVPVVLFADSSDAEDSDCQLLAIVQPADVAPGGGNDLGVIKREPTPEEAGEAVKGFIKIRTRKEVENDGHRRKHKRNTWHVPRSRKRSYHKKCVIVRDSKNVYHARTLKAKFIKEFIKHPAAAAKIKALRERRPVFIAEGVEATRTVDERAAVWPDGIRYLVEPYNPSDIQFPESPDLGKCMCDGDCFFGVCHNSVSAIYCTPDVCKHGGNCSNAPMLRGNLRLFETEDAGLGVYTTTSMEVGDIVGEYCGELVAMEGIRQDDELVQVKNNSGYTMLFNERSNKGLFVYIEPETCGTIARFINHACKPNAAFFEMRNGTSAKVFVILIDSVPAGAEITVSYGKELWFACKCERCKDKI